MMNGVSKGRRLRRTLPMKLLMLVRWWKLCDWMWRGCRNTSCRACAQLFRPCEGSPELTDRRQIAIEKKASTQNKTGRYIELEKGLVSAQTSRPTGKEFDSRTASAEASSYTSSSRAIMTRFLPRACSQSLKRSLQRVALTTRQVTTDNEGPSRRFQTAVCEALGLTARRAGKFLGLHRRDESEWRSLHAFFLDRLETQVCPVADKRKRQLGTELVGNKLKHILREEHRRAKFFHKRF